MTSRSFAQAPSRWLWAVLATLLNGCFFHEAAPERLTPDRIAEVSESVFEVVVPKLTDPGVTYVGGKQPPKEDLPYAERIDKYFGIGTAFALGPDRLVSAAHVFELDFNAASHQYFVRDRHGHVYAVDKVVRYSEYRDLVELTLTRKAPKLTPLKISKRARVGERVYTFGNAEGEGLAVRDGQISSYTFEPVAGAWKDIRFSAPASPGNSGGPLLDTSGDVLGVVVRKNGSENLNVAVPIGELRHLPPASAEFFVPSVEANVNGEPKRDWRFKTPLPAPLATVAKAAEADRRAFHLRQWRAAMAKKGGGFPTDPALAEYAWSQSYGPYLGQVTKDCEGGGELAAMARAMGGGARPAADAKTGPYCLAPPDGDGEPGPAGEAVLATGFVDNFELSYIQLPATADAAAYADHPQRLLDVLVAAFHFVREGAGDEEIAVKSYGPPRSTAHFTDALGRTWMKAAWRTNFDGHTLLLNCLPAPGGLGCALNDLETADETFGAQERFEYGAAQLAMSYEGTLPQWRRFLALGGGAVPKPLRDLRVTVANGAIAFDGGDFHLAYRQPLAGDTSRLFVGVGLGRTHLLSPEIHVVRLSHGKGHEDYEEFALTSGKSAVPSEGEPEATIRVLNRKPVGSRTLTEVVACHGAATRTRAAAATCNAIGASLAH